MTVKTLTGEFIRSSRVVFRPKDSVQAAAVQQWLFAHGIKWSQDGAKIAHISECVAKGMVVDEGRLMHSPSDKAAFNANLHDLDGIERYLGNINEDDFLTPEEKKERRLCALEKQVAGLHTKLDRLIALLEPSVTIKPQPLRKPGGAAP